MADPTPDAIAAFVGPSPSSADRAGAQLERLCLLHVGILIVGASWTYGGNTAAAGTVLSAWGSLAFVLTAAGMAAPGAWARHRRWLLCLLPLVLFDGLVLASVINPSFRSVDTGLGTAFVRLTGGARWPHLPSTARPDLTLPALWFFNAAYLSAFNLLLLVRRRRLLRRLLAVLALNAVALAVLGTLQKLSGAKAVFFATQPAVQPFFFGSFLYHNHWGAFTVLMTAATLGLLFHQLRRRRARDLWHSPVGLALVAVLFLATTLPLSGSRSCTVLVVLLLAVALGHAVARLVRRRRAHGEPVAWPLAAVIVGSVLAVGFMYGISRDMVDQRLANTRQQWAAMQRNAPAAGRVVLYRDTWRLFADQPAFGWGMGAYRTSFYLRNAQHYSSNGPNRLYEDAHSDWLQSLADVGAVGTSLLVLGALAPLWAARRHLRRNPVSGYLLLGCVLIILYAAVEFPFGNRAVVLAFWTCLFTALAYTRLEPGGDSPARPAVPA